MTTAVTPRLPLFEAAGIALEPHPAAKPKRQRRPKPPTPAEQAATARARGARRAGDRQRVGNRMRVGPARVPVEPKVIGFPLSRNAGLLAETINKLPGYWDDNYDKRWTAIGRNVQQKLVRIGIPKDAAFASAHDLLEAAEHVRWSEAQKETVSG